jgi:two-component system heavy metal sensor histidine kinase CusS
VTLTLRARLAAIWTIVFGLLIVVASLVPYSGLKQGLDEDLTLRLSELTDGLHGYLREDGEKLVADFDSNDNDQVAFVQEAMTYYQVYAGDGRLLDWSPAIEPLGLSLAPAEVQAYLGSQPTQDIGTEYGRLRISNSVITGAGGRVYLLRVGVSLASVDKALAQYRELLLTWLPLALAAAIALAWWLSGFALRPLTRVAEAARAIDVRSLERRVPERGAGDELDAVARTFNGILERLEQSVGEMRQFSAALAHELRTPLTALRGEMEIALRRMTPDDPYAKSVASQIEEIDTLKRLIESILTLARAEAGQIPLVFVPVDLGELVSSLAEQLAPVADAQAVTLACSVEPGLIVDGDRSWIERLLINLIDNALKFTPAGGRVDLHAARADGDCRLEVRDTGIGMTPDVAARVFDRFFRADPARSSTGSGSGLGLTLVKWIAERHGGTVTLSSVPGRGSTFDVILPAAGS